MDIKIFGYRIGIYNPFDKKPYGRVIGVNIWKDWHHSYEYDARFSLLDSAHLTVCAAYTNVKKKEYVTKFWTFASKKYREKNGGLKWYSYQESRQHIDDGRNSMG